MFRNTVRLYSNRITHQILINKFKRYLGNTSSAQNGEFTSAEQQTRTPEEITSMKWMQLQAHNEDGVTPSIEANVVVPQTLTLVSENESREFMSFYKNILHDLTEVVREAGIPELTERFAKALQYNLLNGRKQRGLSVVASYKMMESPGKLTSENIYLANILGWCTELLHCAFLVYDDIQDASTSRRGVPCWYTVDGVGLQAINDAVMMESGLYFILKKYFSGQHYYVPLLELFKDITMKTALGQSLDFLSHADEKPQLDCFTMSRYSTLSIYKTSYYTFVLPVAAAMYLAGIYDSEMHRQLNEISLGMGLFLQVQNDFLDCFGNHEITGKKGTDIACGKCSWLVLVALQKATPVQREILKDNYGKPNPENVAAVRKLYEELDLPNAYRMYEKDFINGLHEHIKQMSKKFPPELFSELQKSYMRKG